MSELGVDRGPVRFGLGLAVVAASFATVSLALTGVTAGIVLLVMGVGVLLASAAVGERGPMDIGAVVMFGGVVLTGVGGGTPAPLLAAMVGTVVTWDAAENAISVGEQLGREARTRRVLLVHVAESTLVGVAGATVGLGVYRLAGGGKPFSAVATLLLGAVLVTWAMRR